MTERELLYVMTIAEERNITHAAEKLHMTQPSLTQSLKRIEEELGCPLFARRKYGLDPTKEGLLYLEMAEDVLKRIGIFRDELKKQLNPLSGQIVIGASWYNTLLFLSDLVSQFSFRFPSMQLRLFEKRTTELMSLMVDGTLDIVLAHEYPKEYRSTKRFFPKDIECVRLIDEQFLLIANRDYHIPVTEEGYADVQALANLPFISFNPNQRIRNITDSAFASVGITTRKIVSTQCFPGAMSFAERGLGLTVLPEYYVYRNINGKQNLQKYKLPPELHAYWSASVYYRKGTQSPEVRGCILDLLRDAADSLYRTGHRTGDS